MTSLNIESVFGKSPATFDLIVERFTGLNVLTRLHPGAKRWQTFKLNVYARYALFWMSLLTREGCPILRRLAIQPFLSRGLLSGTTRDFNFPRSAFGGSQERCLVLL